MPQYLKLIISISFFSYIISIQFANAQTKQLKQDSLYEQFKKDSIKIFSPRSVFPLVAVDQRNSFLKTGKNTVSPVNIWGAKFGITMYDRHNMGIGLYSIKNSSKHQRNRDNITIDENLTFQYLTVFYEYSFVETRWWEIGIPIEVGYGKFNIKSFDESKQQYLPDRRGNVIPMGTALDIYFKPTRWFGINVMGGYRYVINNSSRLDLSGWFYSVGGAVYIRQIVQDIKYHSRKKAFRKGIKKLTY